MKAFTALLVVAGAALASAQSQCLSVAAAIPSCGVSSAPSRRRFTTPALTSSRRLRA